MTFTPGNGNIDELTLYKEISSSVPLISSPSRSDWIMTPLAQFPIVSKSKADTSTEILNITKFEYILRVISIDL